MDRIKLLDIALFILRLAMGAIFVAHGAQKVFGLFGGPGIQGFAGALENMGFVQPVLMAWLAGLAELIGGILLIGGIFPRTGATMIACVMAVAAVKVHGPNGLFASNSGFEYPLLALSVAVALAFTGGGKLSLLDRF